MPTPREEHDGGLPGATVPVPQPPPGARGTKLAEVGRGPWTSGATGVLEWPSLWFAPCRGPLGREGGLGGKGWPQGAPLRPSWLQVP